MSIAALYDIHANLPALDAVLEQVPADATIVLGGDHVYGPFPAETLERLRALGDRAVWLRGNCDRELSEPGAGPASVDVLDWVRARLTDDDDRWVAGRRVVNAGSVGMAGEDEPGAYWALLGERVELRRVAFDAGALTASAGYPRPWWDA